MDEEKETIRRHGVSFKKKIKRQQAELLTLMGTWEGEGRAQQELDDDPDVTQEEGGFTPPTPL